MLYLSIWAGMLKNYCDICNQHPPICLMVKFREKIRILKFGTKNALFGCFGQLFWKNIVIFEKHRPPICLIAKHDAKNKNPVTWDQKYQICVFCSSNLNMFLSYLKSAPSDLSNCKVS